MSLDTSKLNLQGIGALKSNASMVSGVDPGDTFNLTVKADDANHNWSSTTTTLSNITSISGSSTFTIKPNPGFQVNSSMFSSNQLLEINDNNEYYSKITFSNTLNNLDPLNEVEVTVYWITQSISSNIDIVILNISVEEEFDGNIYHKNEVNINDINENYYEINLIALNNTQINGNIAESIIVLGEQIQLFKISLTVKEEFQHITAFNGNTSIVFNPSSSAVSSDYSIELVQTVSPFTSREFIVSFSPNLDHINIFNYSDLITIYPNAIQPSIDVSQSSIVAQNTGGNHTVNLTLNNTELKEFKAYMGENDEPHNALSEQVNWISFDSVSYIPDANILSFTVTAQIEDTPRYAHIYLWNTVNHLDFNKSLNSIFITQSSNEVLTVTLIENESDFNGVIQPNSLSVVDISNTGGVISYSATINDYQSWDMDALIPSINDYILITSNNEVSDNSWLTNNMTVNSSPVSPVLNFQFNIQPNDSNVQKSSDITISRPQSIVTTEFTLTQQRAWDYSQDDFTLYVGNTSHLIDTGIPGGNYYDLPVFNGASVDVNNLPYNLYFGVQLSAMDSDLSINDFTITSNHTELLGLFDMSNIFNMSLVPYDFMYAVSIPENTSLEDFVFTVQIEHPYYNNASIPAKIITINQAAVPGAWFLDNGQPVVPGGSIEDALHVEIINNGTIETSIFATDGNTPQVVLGGLKEFEYAEGEIQPSYSQDLAQNMNNSWFGASNGINPNNGIQGFNTFGITTAPIITIPGGSETGTVHFTFEGSDQETVEGFNTYRQWFFYLYPSSANVSTLGAGINNQGLANFATDNGELPSLLIVTQRVIAFTDSIKFNSIMNNFAPFNLTNAIVYAPALTTNTVNTSNLSLNAASQESVEDYLKQDCIPVVSYSAGSINSSFNFINNLSETIDDIAFNTMDTIIGFNLTDSALSFSFTFIEYQIMALNGISLGTVSNATHLSNPQGVTIPTITIHNDGSALGYPIGFENYIKLHVPPIPSTLVVSSVTQNVGFLVFNWNMIIGDETFTFKIQRGAVSSSYITQGPAVFLLAGGSNMVGKADDDSVSYPVSFGGIKQYKYTTYNADNTDTTLHDASSPLDHVDELAGDMGLAKNFVIQLRNNNYFDNRQIILIPAADSATGFTDSKWGTGEANYNTAVGMTNALMGSLPSDATFEGVLWHQGEEDYQNNDFAKDFYYMVQSMRQQITDATVLTPFILGNLPSSGDNTNTWTDFVHTQAENMMHNVVYSQNTSAGTIGGGDNVHFSAAGLNTMGLQYYNSFINFNTLANLAPVIPSSGNSEVQVFFGLDNQKMKSVDSTGFGGALKYGIEYDPSNGTPLPGSSTLVDGTSMSGITYDTFTYNNTNTHVAGNLAYVNISGQATEAISTGIADYGEMTFAIVYKAQGYSSGASNRGSIIFGNIGGVVSSTLESGSIPTASDALGAGTSQWVQTKGFGLFTSPEGKIRLVSRRIGAESGVGGNYSDVLANPVADKWYLIILECSAAGVEARIHQSATGNAIQMSSVYAAVSNEGRQISDHDVFIGNGLYVKSQFEHTVQVAYFAAALQLGNNTNTGINYDNWANEIRVMMALRGITLS